MPDYGIKNIVMIVIACVIAISLVGIVWDSVYDVINYGVNSTSATLLKLVPVVYVGSTIIGGVVVGWTIYDRKK